MMSSRVLATVRPLSRSLRPLISSTHRTFALDSKSTASSSGPTKTGQSPAGGANNQQAGSSTGINASHNAQKQTTAHSTGAAAGANTGDRPATSTPMSGTGTGHDQSQSMDSYARQADKASKDGGKASHSTSAKTAVAGSGNAASGDETMSGGTAKGSKSSGSSGGVKGASGATGTTSSTAGQSTDSPAGTSNSNVGSGGAIGSQGSPTVGGGGGSSRTTTGDRSTAGTGLGSGGVTGMTDKAKEKIHELTGDVELPPAGNYTVILATLLAVPLLFWMDPDYRWLKNESKEQEKRIFDKYHGI